MRVYLEGKDIQRKITTYHDGLGTQQGLYVYGKDKIEVLSLADYTKQVRKEVCDEIRNKLKENGLLYTWKGEPKFKTMEELLDRIQDKGE